MFLLLPTGMATQIFAYCLAIAQMETGVLIHAAQVLSNHYHIVLTDPLGKLPLFTEILNKYVAKCLNAHYGRWENFWEANQQTSHVRLPDDRSKVEKAAYTLANVVEAGLVRRREYWPGLQLIQPGKQRRKRPSVFFQDSGPMPEVATLEITPLPLESVERPQDVMALVGKAIADREAFFRKKYDAEGRRFLGKNKVLAQSHLDSPKSFAPKRGISPRVASRNKWRRIEVLQRLKSFVDGHRRSLARWISGERDVEFPAGTYQARLRFGVCCAET
jgi:REP element-mobilizing transposase RayT